VKKLEALSCATGGEAWPEGYDTSVDYLLASQPEASKRGLGTGRLGGLACSDRSAPIDRGYARSGKVEGDAEDLKSRMVDPIDSSWSALLYKELNPTNTSSIQGVVSEKPQE
jgi:hypothetical protein